MDLIPNKEIEKEIKEEEKLQKERRKFVKKALYSAPVLIPLGALLRPTETKADFGPPPSSPDTW